MGIIHQLDSFTANSIAAGEVVERPSSVVKELIENSLDAGASVITIEARQGGIRLIRITDNGCGLDPTDARLAFLRHSTSKIQTIDDLQSIQTMGFRGEALASMAAVSEITMETRPPQNSQGYAIRLAAGEIIQEQAAGCPAGTMIQVENLFYNQPARFKFLKRDQTEASHITDLIERLSLARPDISFRLMIDGKEILHTPGNDDLLSSIFSVYGKETANACLPIDFEESPIQISGYIASPDQARHNRSRQNFFVNGRLIRSRMLTAALDEATRTWFMKGRYPVIVLNIILPVPLVDVNVHPQKMEVRFWDEKKVFHCLFHAVRQSLNDESGIPGQESDVPIPSAALPLKESAEQTSSLDALHTSEYLYQPALMHQQESAANPEMPQAIVRSVSVEDKNELSDSVPEKSLDASIDQTAEAEIAYSNESRTRISFLQDARIIGQAFQTYLIMEQGSDLYLIDQHAAHERILYEKLLKNSQRAENEPVSIQTLLIPEPIHVTRSEKNALMAQQDEIIRLGFDFDDFGEDSVVLRGVPSSASDHMVPAAAFRVLVDSLNADEFASLKKLDRVYESIACKAAVKANDLLQSVEMERLLQDLQELENPYHCPHGRPVIIRISSRELEKRFKRIV